MKKQNGVFQIILMKLIEYENHKKSNILFSVFIWANVLHSALFATTRILPLEINGQIAESVFKRPEEYKNRWD